MANYLQHMTWTPGIGDPSFVGWLTVALYFCVSFCCYQVYLSRELIFDRNKVQQSTFWFSLVIIFALLGINKQMDFQSLLTDIGRAIAREHDWYQHRKAVQAWFIQGVIVGGVVMIGTLIFIFRTVLKANALAIIGLCVLVSFIAIRATSFHHVDYFIKLQFFGVRLNWGMEICSILLVGANTSILLKLKKTRVATNSV